MDLTQRHNHSRKLLKSFLAGDHKAYDEFYHLHYASLLRFGLTVSKDRGEVRDQLQEVFV